MLADSYGRIATDLRVSLTDRCNLRCAYCMPPEGLDWLPAPTLLTDDEVVRLARIGVERLGITEIRYTGGEPLLRRGLPGIVARTAALRPRMSYGTQPAFARMDSACSRLTAYSKWTAAKAAARSGFTVVDEGVAKSLVLELIKTQGRANPADLNWPVNSIACSTITESFAPVPFFRAGKLHAITESLMRSTFPASCLLTSVHCSAKAKDHSAGLLFPVIRKTFIGQMQKSKSCFRKMTKFIGGSTWPVHGLRFKVCLLASAGLV